MTIWFNVLTAMNDLIFAYFLHKISTRMPSPNQSNIIPQNIGKTKRNWTKIQTFFQRLILPYYPRYFVSELTAVKRRQLLDIQFSIIDQQQNIVCICFYFYFFHALHFVQAYK